MSSVLSQDEIDQLLTAINADEEDDDGSGFPSVSGRGYNNQSHDSSKSRKIKIYDFKRPDVMSHRDIRLAAQEFEKATRNVEERSRGVTVHVSSFDQLTFEELIRSIPDPTFISIFSVSLDGRDYGLGMIESDIEISSAFIHAAFDGSEATYRPRPSIHVSPLDLLVMTGFHTGFIEILSTIMSDTYGKRVMMKFIETTRNVIECRRVDPGKMVGLCSMEMHCFSSEGMVNMFCGADFYKKLFEQKSERPGTYELPDSTQFDFRVFTKPIRVKASDLVNLTLGTNFQFSKELLVKSDGKTIMMAQFHQSGGLRMIKIEKRDELWRDGLKQSVKTVGLENMTVDLSVELGQKKMSLFDVRKIEEGTLIELNKISGEPVDVYANDSLIAKAEVVVIDDFFGVRIVDLVEPDGLPD